MEISYEIKTHLKCIDVIIFCVLFSSTRMKYMGMYMGK